MDVPMQLQQLSQCSLPRPSSPVPQHDADEGDEPPHDKVLGVCGQLAQAGHLHFEDQQHEAGEAVSVSRWMVLARDEECGRSHGQCDQCQLRADMTIRKICTSDTAGVAGPELAAAPPSAGLPSSLDAGSGAGRGCCGAGCRLRRPALPSMPWRGVTTLSGLEISRMQHRVGLKTLIMTAS